MIEPRKLVAMVQKWRLDWSLARLSKSVFDSFDGVNLHAWAKPGGEFRPVAPPSINHTYPRCFRKRNTPIALPGVSRAGFRSAQREQSAEEHLKWKPMQAPHGHRGFVVGLDPVGFDPRPPDQHG